MPTAILTGGQGFGTPGVSPQRPTGPWLFYTLADFSAAGGVGAFVKSDTFDRGVRPADPRRFLTSVAHPPGRVTVIQR